MKCIWTKRALHAYMSTVKYIAEEFGKYPALKYIEQMEYWDERIHQYPKIGAPEPLLAHKTRYVYRSLIASKHSKLIYTIDKKHPFHTGKKNK